MNKDEKSLGDAYGKILRESKPQEKNAMNSILNSRAEKFTKDVRAGKYEIQEPKRGAEGNSPAKFKVGELVKSNGVGNRVAGVEGKVTDVYDQHGYWYYVVSGMGVQRQKDLVKA